MAGAVRRMRERQLSMAWEQWQWVAGALTRQQYMVGGAVKRMMQRELSMAWEKWQFEAAEMKHQRTILDQPMRHNG